ncbi:hypothetical protein [Aquibaculum sediminis]|uniref:hypothetical protein n=1 Tax=Aquibaculum sediminis TaxID=3231907 RepID=UPI003452248A
MPDLNRSRALLPFLLHVLAGNPYEMRTLGALLLRLTVWIAISAIAHRARRIT